MSAAARMQGRRATMTESSARPSRSTRSFSNPAGSAIGSTTSTFFTPTARASPSIETLPVCSCSSVRPVPGCSCWPVMAGVLLRQDVAQAEPDAERRAHGDAAVQALVRREDAERVAADVPRDDRVVLAERGVDRVVGARLAQRGRPPLRQLGLGRDVAREDAADPAHVELAEAERLELRLDRDPRGPDRVREVRIALLHDDAALDRSREGAD